MESINNFHQSERIALGLRPAKPAVKPLLSDTAVLLCATLIVSAAMYLQSYQVSALQSDNSALIKTNHFLQQELDSDAGLVGMCA